MSNRIALFEVDAVFAETFSLSGTSFWSFWRVLSIVVSGASGQITGEQTWYLTFQVPSDLQIMTFCVCLCVYWRALFAFSSCCCLFKSQALLVKRSHWDFLVKKRSQTRSQNIIVSTYIGTYINPCCFFLSSGMGARDKPLYLTWSWKTSKCQTPGSLPT